MIYAYVRISKDKQSTENQRFEILKFADEKRLQIDEWIDETVTGVQKARLRKLGPLLDRMKSDDMLIVSEISRLGRSLMEVMNILYQLMEKDVKVFTVKERYALGNTMNAKVLAFAFSLSAEIERAMISSRTKEVLARKKSEGVHLGRPKGRLSTVTKLTGKEDALLELLRKKVSYSAIARIMGVNRATVHHFITSRKLDQKVVRTS
jgi:DNA invertase Pin-like site-specific DNA recombinase